MLCPPLHDYNSDHNYESSGSSGNPIGWLGWSLDSYHMDNMYIGENYGNILNYQGVALDNSPRTTNRIFTDTTYPCWGYNQTKHTVRVTVDSDYPADEPNIDNGYPRTIFASKYIGNALLTSDNEKPSSPWHPSNHIVLFENQDGNQQDGNQNEEGRYLAYDKFTFLPEQIPDDFLASSIGIPSGWSALVFGENVLTHKCITGNEANLQNLGDFPGTNTPINDNISAIYAIPFNPFCMFWPDQESVVLYKNPLFQYHRQLGDVDAT